MGLDDLAVPIVLAPLAGGPSTPELTAAGSEVWLTVTTRDEAAEARGAGADVLVAQGAEAGGHRASFVDRPGLPVYGLLALLQILARTESLPLVASGGIATGAGLAAAL